MPVRGDRVNKPVRQELPGELLCLPATARSDQRVGVQLDQHSLARQQPEQGGVALEVTAALGMAERDAIALILQDADELIEPCRWRERRLEQQVGAELAVARERKLLVAGLERPDQRHLGAGD